MRGLPTRLLLQALFNSYFITIHKSLKIYGFHIGYAIGEQLLSTISNERF